MKTKTHVRAAAMILAALATMFPACLVAQSIGRIEFTARVTPTGGQAEPVRQLTFYLLRKSLEDIRTEVSQTTPPLDLAKFIDTLSVSSELKAWMNKHHSVRLSGEEFTKSLEPDDVVDVPEFFKAYMTHNEAFKGIGFPEPKFRAKDRDAKPEKYKADKENYRLAVRNFIAAAPDTVKGMDLELINLNPYPQWLILESKHRRALDAAATQLAEERYIIARTDTDLDGHGTFAGLPPGNYWIGMLATDAIAGDVRQNWDFRIIVRPGETASVELSNFNAVRSETAAQNSNN